jgi:hypothetical protein
MDCERYLIGVNMRMMESTGGASGVRERRVELGVGWRL